MCAVGRPGGGDRPAPHRALVEAARHARGLRPVDWEAGRQDGLDVAGGSSGVPLLREQLAQVQPSARHIEGDLFGGVGSGLARDVARRFG